MLIDSENLIARIKVANVFPIWGDYESGRRDTFNIAISFIIEAENIAKESQPKADEDAN